MPPRHYVSSMLLWPTVAAQRAVGRAYSRRLRAGVPPSLRTSPSLRFYSAASDTAAPSPVGRSKVGRFLSFCALSIFFTTVGFIMATAPAIPAMNGLITPPSDEETLTMYEPLDEECAEVDSFIRNHPLSRSLRENSDFTESRPQMKIPDAQRSHNFTGGTLSGPGKIVVPPFQFSEKGGKSMVGIYYLGTDMCGHAGIVHGGLLATLLDEGLARCCFPALPNKIGMTATLTVNYRKPAPAGAFVVLRAKTIKVEGRKAWVEGHIETLVGEGEVPVVLVEASALFIEPKQAAAMARIYPVGA